jgi:hypothetical protein
VYVDNYLRILVQSWMTRQDSQIYAHPTASGGDRQIVHNAYSTTMVKYDTDHNITTRQSDNTDNQPTIEIKGLP